MAYANGKHAKFISDRSGMEYPYTEMVKEWNGSRVHKSEFEPKTPQDNPKRHTSDAEALQNPRPDRTENAVATLLPRNSFRFTASSTTVSVFEPDHGRSSSDTVRFRDVTGNLFGASVTELEDSDGYSITKQMMILYIYGVNSTRDNRKWRWRLCFCWTSNIE